MTEETKRKIALANTGKVRTNEAKNKLREINLGKKHSEETKAKMSNSHKGKKHPVSGDHAKRMGLANKGRKTTEETKKKIGDSFREEKSYAWKGDDVGYRGLHRWVEKHLGKPNKCVHCGKVSDEKREMQWANISGKYLRDISDWVRLCRKCHVAMDNNLRKNK